jgi:hypothetical protein
MLLALWRSGMHPVMLAGGDNKDGTTSLVTTHDGVGLGCDSGADNQDGLDPNAATATRATTPSPVSPSGQSNGGMAGRYESPCFDAEVRGDDAAWKSEKRKEGLDLVAVAVCDVGQVSHAMKLRERCSDSPTDSLSFFSILTHTPLFLPHKKDPKGLSDLKSSPDPNLNISMHYLQSPDPNLNISMHYLQSPDPNLNISMHKLQDSCTIGIVSTQIRESQPGVDLDSGH